ncbi:hypothetical protein Tco_1100944 [Tanacetum coccineum]
MENRIWSEDDKRRSKEFMEVIERRLKIRIIFRSLESFVSRSYKVGKVRSKSENKEIVPTEMELVLEQTKQGTSHEVSVKMDDPNITMEEYIRLEEEKARRRVKVSVETEFPAIVYNDALTSEVALSCEPMVSPLNDNQINFRISFDESDDEDYTVIYDKNSFSYKIIYVNDLKTDSENDNDKVNMPSFSSSEPTVEPTVSPQHIDEFNLKNETSLSECDDNDNEKVDIKQPSGDIFVIPLPNVINADVGAYAQGSNKSITIWAKLVWILISEGFLSLLKILGKKSLAEMFTRLAMNEKLKFCAASTSL